MNMLNIIKSKVLNKTIKKEPSLTRMDRYYMKVAEFTADLSRAEKLKVGCVVVKDDNIISFSWNGTPKGFDNACEHSYLGFNNKLITLPEVVHSEMNAISKLAKSNTSSDGSSLYITHSPCYDCAKAIIQSGIKKVYYKTEYRDKNPLSLLKKAGLEVIKVVDNE